MDQNFLWGSATASYQCEGGYQEDDKALSIWDVYLHERNLENGDVLAEFQGPTERIDFLISFIA